MSLLEAFLIEGVHEALELDTLSPHLAGEVLSVAEAGQLLARSASYNLQQGRRILARIRVCQALPRFVDFRGLLFDCHIDVAFNLRTFKGGLVEDESHEFHHGGLGVSENVLVADYVDRDLRVHPEVMEVLPHGDFLLDKLIPLIVELGIVVIVNRFVVRASTYHIEERRYRIQGVPNFQDALLTIELSLAVSFWVMGLDYHDPLVDEAFSLESHGQ